MFCLFVMSVVASALLMPTSGAYWPIIESSITISHLETPLPALWMTMEILGGSFRLTFHT